MTSCTKVTCSKIKDRDPVFKSGQMAANMKENGKMTEPTAVVGFLIPMVTFMKENGPMIRRMVMGSTNIQMVANTRGTGRKTFMTAMENTPYKMALFTRDNSKMDLNMEKAFSNITTILYTMAILRKIC